MNSKSMHLFISKTLTDISSIKQKKKTLAPLIPTPQTCHTSKPQSSSTIASFTALVRQLLLTHQMVSPAIYVVCLHWLLLLQLYSSNVVNVLFIYCEYRLLLSIESADFSKHTYTEFDDLPKPPFAWSLRISKISFSIEFMNF